MKQRCTINENKSAEHIKHTHSRKMGTKSQYDIVFQLKCYIVHTVIDLVILWLTRTSFFKMLRTFLFVFRSFVCQKLHKYSTVLCDFEFVCFFLNHVRARALPSRQRNGTLVLRTLRMRSMDGGVVYLKSLVVRNAQKSCNNQSRITLPKHCAFLPIACHLFRAVSTSNDLLSRFVSLLSFSFDCYLLHIL